MKPSNNAMKDLARVHYTATVVLGIIRFGSQHRSPLSSRYGERSSGSGLAKTAHVRFLQLPGRRHAVKGGFHMNSIYVAKNSYRQQSSRNESRPSRLSMYLSTALRVS